MRELDEIGLIPDVIGEIDEEGNQISETTFKTGWHVNSLELIPEFSAYLLDPQPATPYRVFLGVENSFAYQFPDQEVFNALKETINS